MKVIKLILTFAIILGVVVGGFYLTNMNSDSGLESISPSIYEQYRKQIEQEWSDKGTWDLELFQNQCGMINILSKKHNTATLRDLVTGTATEKLYEAIFKEWNTSSCKPKTIKSYMNDLKAIIKYDVNTEKNPAALEIVRVNNAYNNAINQAYRNISLKPIIQEKGTGLYWEGEDNNGNRENKGKPWSSFEEYSKYITNKKNEVLGNSDYQKYLSNITDIKTRLLHYPDGISSAKKRFYDELAIEVVNYYKEIPDSTRTREQLNMLRDARKRYDAEYEASTAMNDFAKEFNTDVINNETRTLLNDRY